MNIFFNFLIFQGGKILWNFKKWIFFYTSEDKEYHRIYVRLVN